MTDDPASWRRAREQRSLQKELGLTRQEFPSRDPEMFARELRAFEQRASALADKLAPAVRACMLDGFVGEIGGEYGKLVRRRFSEWLHGSEPEALGLSACLEAAAHRRLKAYQGRGVIGKANETIDAQAWHEAIQLAQLLLANWNAYLEHARQDRRHEAIEALFQTRFYPLPMGVLVGAGLYRLPIEVTAEIFAAYLRPTERSSRAPPDQKRSGL